jgi:hypothetical protein
MMENLSQPGEGGGCTNFPFYYIYQHVEVYASAGRAETLFLYLLYLYMYSVDMISRVLQGESATFSLPTAPRHFLVV